MSKPDIELAQSSNKNCKTYDKVLLREFQLQPLSWMFVLEGLVESGTRKDHHN